MTALESLHKISYWDQQPRPPRFQYFSVQQGIDCTGPRYDCNYCNGGWASSVFKYVADNDGVCFDHNYPYEEKRGRCQDKRCRSAFQISGSRDISRHNERNILKHLAVNPLAVMVTGGTREFRFYRRGIISDCGQARQADLSVVAVAFNVRPRDEKDDYIEVQTSWGREFGMGGKVRLKFGENMCKYRSNIHYPFLATPPKNDSDDGDWDENEESESSCPSTFEEPTSSAFINNP